MNTRCTRREMMKGFGLTTLAMGLNDFPLLVQTALSKETELSPVMENYKLPPLPYDYDALEPYIDKETLTLHHSKHHAGYVKKCTAAMKKLSEARRSGDYSLVKHWSREVAFHGSGHILHSLYWQSMSPKGGKEPKGELLPVIKRDFGSFANFKAQFLEATKEVEGSGWGIFCLEPLGNRLLILQAEKHHDLTIWGVYPLMVCDVWEHAYYLKYQNRRSEYIKNFMKIINWSTVERRYTEAKSLLQ